MAKRGVRIKISDQRMEALCNVCSNMLTEFKPKDEHQRLLKEYMADLYHKIKKMHERNQGYHTLHMTETEAMAFYQLWHLLDIEYDTYAVIVIDALLNKMSALAA